MMNFTSEIIFTVKIWETLGTSESEDRVSFQFIITQTKHAQNKARWIHSKVFVQTSVTILSICAKFCVSVTRM